MIPLALAASDVLFAVVGWSFLALIGITAWLGPGVRLLGLAYLTGWALLGVALSLALIVGFPLTLTSVILLAGVLTVACGLGARRGWFVPLPRSPLRPARIDRFFSLIGAVALAAGAVTAIAASIRGQWNSTNDFDVFLFWLPKAETIYVAHGLDATLWRQFVHAEYPPLAPTMNAVTFTFSGGFHPALLPFQQTLLGLSFLLGILALLDRMVPRRLSVPTLALLATAPWFWAQLHSVMPEPNRRIHDRSSSARRHALAARTAPCLARGRRRLPRSRNPDQARRRALGPHDRRRPRGRRSCTVRRPARAPGGSAPSRAGIIPCLARLVARTPAPFIVPRLLPLQPLSSRLPQPEDSPSTPPRSARSPTPPARCSPKRSHSAGSARSATPRPTSYSSASPYSSFSSHARHPQSPRPVACWLVLAYTGLATIYWIGRIPVQQYIAETIDRVLETPAVVTLTLLPLLLAVALRLNPTTEPTDPEVLTSTPT